MCTSLSHNGYDVSLVVADNLQNDVVNDVSIYDVGKGCHGRLSRMTKTVNRVYKKAQDLNADIYHLHDPELMPIGVKLIKLGKKVIFDAHEDLPQQLLGKPYLNKVSRYILSKIFALYEHRVCSKFDAVIAATPCIGEKFSKINPKTVEINNFPLLDELSNTSNWSQKLNEVAYVGGITKIRGIEEVIHSLNFTQEIKLNLVGEFSEKEVEESVKNNKGWDKVNQFGFLDRVQVNEVLAKSKAGLVTFLPAPNHLDSQPNKMFEYMSAGLPIITSDFPMWRKIVDSSQCGVCVNPLDPKSISQAILYLIDQPVEAEKMGKNGRKAIEEKYNWSVEEKKLFQLYRDLSE